MANKLPVRKLVLPKALLNQKNGQLDPSLLRDIKPGGKLFVTAAISYHAMKRAAKLDGIVLKPTSAFDAYRPYSVQKAVFEQRYTSALIPGRPTRTWNGVTYSLKPGLAPLATPGTSNHGWGLAVDVWSVGLNGRLEWLLANQKRFGWSHEVQSEPWHIRYTLGDKLPPGLTA
jgi:LAS superfamily LD-carboxypeptidase LdcB